ncbi:MAG: IS200/IS605 family element RNA-guided endonuclease TnpB [Bacillota bacterium]|nr:IS200/IS605 family element RNA-guided endonuclease TnpB [Bacillota bacterium]
MKSYKAYKFRIYPNKSQQSKLAQNFGCCRFVFNHFLALQKGNYEKGGKYISYNTLAKELPILKKQNPFLKEVDSISLQQELRHLDIAFQRFFKMKESGYPKFKSKKKHFFSYSTVCINNNIRIEGKKITVPKIGLVRIKQHRTIPKEYILKGLTIEQTPSGKYFAVLLFEYEKQVREKKVVNTVGLDYASDGLFVDSNGNCCGYPKFFRKAQDKLAFEERKLSRMQKGSHNWEKQRIKVAKVHEKIANQRADFLNKQSLMLAENYDLVGIEDLDMKAMSQSLHLGKSVSDNGWGMFTSMLSYKLTDRGGHLVKVSKTFPSSQLCSCCGYQNPKTKDLSVRKWKCPNCGTDHNRDINAAINIQKEAMRLLSA